MMSNKSDKLKRANINYIKSLVNKNISDRFNMDKGLRVTPRLVPYYIPDPVDVILRW